MVVYQNAGRIHSVRIDNNTFDRVEEFKYLGTTVTNQNAMGTEVPTASLKKTTQKYSRQKENIPQFVGNLFQT